MSLSLLIDKYSNSNNALKLQLANIDNELLELNNQRNGILERLAFNEVNLQNIMQQDTPSLGYLSNELIKIIVSYMDAYKQKKLFNANKHYRKYKMMTCYYTFNKKRSYEYLINHNGMRDKIERSLANPSQQISLTFANRSIPDVSVLANVHSLTLHKCTGVKDVSSLSKLSYIDLTGTRGITDISALVNVDTLKLVDMNRKINNLPSNLNVKHLTIQMKSITNFQGFSNCTSLNISNSIFLFNDPAVSYSLANIQDLYLFTVNFSAKIDGWNNKSLFLKEILDLKEIKNLKNMSALDIVNCNSLESVLNIDNIDDVRVINCTKILKIQNISNIKNLSLSQGGGYWNSNGKCKEILDVRNVDSMTLSDMPALTTLANICNVNQVEISLCRALLNLSAILHPLANVQKLTLDNLKIVDLDVQGRIPIVSVTDCDSLVNVSGLAGCQKVLISQCAAVTDVSSLGQVKELQLSYWTHNTNQKSMLGLEMLGNVTVLSLTGIDLASHDLRCYSDVKMLTLSYCSNLNMPLEILRLHYKDKEPKSFNVNDCKFDPQNERDIQAKNAELETFEIKFYFGLNRCIRKIQGNDMD